MGGRQCSIACMHCKEQWWRYWAKQTTVVLLILHSDGVCYSGTYYGSRIMRTLHSLDGLEGIEICILHVATQ